MKRRVEHFSDIFNPVNTIVFIIGSLVLAISGNAAAELVFRTFGRDTPRLIAILVVSLGLLGAFFLFLRHLSRLFERTRKKPTDVHYGESVQPRRGLIVFVSAGRGTAHRDAFDHHVSNTGAPTLEHCWLIYSPLSREKALDFKREKESTKVTIHASDENGSLLGDVNDVALAYQTFLSMIDRAFSTRTIPPLSVDDLIVDVTGGTAIVTTGAIWACTKSGVSSEYIKQIEGPKEIIQVNADRIEDMRFLPSESTTPQ